MANDRLLLGMKGTMSELELSLFRQPSQEALKQKVRRGALILGVAAGYVKVGLSCRFSRHATRHSCPRAFLFSIVGYGVASLVAEDDTSVHVAVIG